MKLTDKQIKELGYMFQKAWMTDDTERLNGFTMALDALGIPWRLIPDKATFSAVEIDGNTFKL